jgi:hypothetical protein
MHLLFRGFGQVSDFDVMLMKKKETLKKRKRKADIDIINDNDDIIDQLLADMRHAAEVSVTKPLCGTLLQVFENIYIWSGNFYRNVEQKFIIVKSLLFFKSQVGLVAVLLLIVGFCNISCTVNS